jgi:hypothetical protein
MKMSPQDAAAGYQAPEEGVEDDTAQFDARVTTDGTLADTFFTNDHSNPAHTAPSRFTMFTGAPGPETVVYTDGFSLDNNTDEVKAGAGVFFGVDDPRNKATLTPPNCGLVCKSFRG